MNTTDLNLIRVYISGLLLVGGIFIISGFGAPRLPVFEVLVFGVTQASGVWLLYRHFPFTNIF